LDPLDTWFLTGGIQKQEIYFAHCARTAQDGEVKKNLLTAPLAISGVDKTAKEVKECLILRMGYYLP